MNQTDNLLREHMTLYPLLPADAREVILRFVPLFLRNKEIEGKNGLVVEDLHRVLIAANAALVGAAQRVSCFASVRWVLLYPRIAHLDGEAFRSSKVILSWDCVAEESRHLESGSNLVVHEFAHVLDSLLGISHGTAAMRDAFDLSEKFIVGGGESIYRPEDIESPQEFFAASSELFFSAPRLLRNWFPDLYQDLKGLYGLDMQLYIER